MHKSLFSTAPAAIDEISLRLERWQPQTMNTATRTALLVFVSVLVAGCAGVPVTPPPPPAGPVSVKLIAFNDFHGNLRTPNLRVPVPDATQSTGMRFERAGGVEQFSALVNTLRAGNRNTAVVSAGDMVGATPLLSALFKDEPTIEAMNLIGLDIHAVGNHEFDYGVPHLRRLVGGGCAPDKSGKPDCQGRTPYAGAKFSVLAANVVDAASGATLFPAYAVREFEGVKVGFIGMTLKNTPTLVRPGGTAGMVFQDEVETANRLVPELKKQGVEAIVVIVHEGGEQSGGINECTNFRGPVRGIVERLDPAIDVVVTGHTHRFYVCDVANKLVTSAGSFGTLLTEIDLQIDRTSRDVVAKRARNVIVSPDGPTDPKLSDFLRRYIALGEPLEKRVVARVSRELSTVATPGGESALGNLIVDAQLAATASPERGGAVIAFNNASSVRAPLVPDADGGVTYGMLFASQPFQNDLVVMNLTGAQLKRVLEQQQWGLTPGERRLFLGVSTGFSYAWDASRSRGDRVVPGSIKLNGVAIRDDLQYRVAMNSFIAGGGDGFTVFTEGTDRQVSVQDLEALVEYLSARSANAPFEAPMPGTRVARLN
jgi:5'-nucleotidase